MAGEIEIDYEQHKNDFMLYVWENLDELNRCIRKNITFDPDIYDDVTSNTLVRIAEYIVRKQQYIRDFKNMFFLSAKREYIAEQTKKRERQKNSNRDFLDNIYNGEEKRNKADTAVFYRLVDNNTTPDEIAAERTHKLFRYLEDKLNETFEPIESDLFLIYFRLKSEKKGISYKKLSEIMDKDVKYITKTIVKIKKYIRENNEIQEMKRRIMNGLDE